MTSSFSSDQGSTPYTQRVEVGAYYTDGHYLAEVVEVNPLGYVHMVDTRTHDAIGAGISAFRRRWWLVRAVSEGTER